MSFCHRLLWPFVSDYPMENYHKEFRASSLIQITLTSPPCTVIALWVCPVSPPLTRIRVLAERSSEPQSRCSAGPGLVRPRYAQHSTVFNTAHFSSALRLFSKIFGQQVGKIATTSRASMCEVWMTEDRWQEDSGEFRYSSNKDDSWLPLHPPEQCALGDTAEALTEADWPALHRFLPRLFLDASCDPLSSCQSLYSSLLPQTLVSGSSWERQDGIADRGSSAKTHTPVAHCGWVSHILKKGIQRERIIKIICHKTSVCKIKDKS